MCRAVALLLLLLACAHAVTLGVTATCFQCVSQVVYGFNGTNGAQGPNGTQGLQGLTGPQGPQGPAGPAVDWTLPVTSPILINPNITGVVAGTATLTNTTLVTPVLKSLYGSGAGLLSMPNTTSADTLVSTNMPQTLASKTLTNPVMSGPITVTGDITSTGALSVTGTVTVGSLATSGSATVSAITASDQVRITTVSATKKLVLRDFSSQAPGKGTTAAGTLFAGLGYTSTATAGALRFQLSGPNDKWSFVYGNSADNETASPSTEAASITAAGILTVSGSINTPGTATVGALSVAGAVAASDQVRITPSVSSATKKLVLRDFGSGSSTVGTSFAGLGYVPWASNGALRFQVAGFGDKWSFMVGNSDDNEGITPSTEAASITAMGIAKFASITTTGVTLQYGYCNWAVSGSRTGLTVQAFGTQSGVLFTLSTDGSYVPASPGTQLFALTMTTSATVFPRAFTLLTGITQTGTYSAAPWGATWVPVMALTTSAATDATYQTRVLTFTGNTNAFGLITGQFTVFYTGF